MRTRELVLAETIAVIGRMVREFTGQTVPAIEGATALDEIDGLDSLRIIETVALLEDQFAVVIDPRALDRLRTVDDIAWSITNAT